MADRVASPYEMTPRHIMPPAVRPATPETVHTEPVRCAATQSPTEGKPMAHQPDRATAQSNDKPFPIHPEGQFAARCVDVINLGMSVISFPGATDYLAEKCVLIFYTGEKGHLQAEDGSWDVASAIDPSATDRIVHVAQEYTLSMGKKAKLRAMAAGWRGKPYSDEEAKKGIDVSAFYGHPALISVGHKTSESTGRTRVELLSVVKLPAQMKTAIPPIEGITYTRDEWWTKRKATTQKETEEWLAKNRPESKAGRVTPSDRDFGEFPPPMDEDDSLPF